MSTPTLYLIREKITPKSFSDPGDFFPVYSTHECSLVRFMQKESPRMPPASWLPHCRHRWAPPNLCLLGTLSRDQSNLKQSRYVMDRGSKH